MTVPKYLRKENKLEVLNKTRALAVHSLKCSRTEKIFPNKKLADDVGELGTEIFRCCFRANRLRIPRRDPEDEDGRLAVVAVANERDSLQTEAIELCELLLAELEVAYEANRKEFRAKKLEYWGGLVLECEKLILGWRKSDRSTIKSIKNEVKLNGV